MDGGAEAQNAAGDKARAASQIEVLARSAGAFLVLVYGLGFLVLSLHEAKFGVSQFNPFRTKIFAVGLVFVCLTALPGAALHYSFAYYGGLETITTPHPGRTEKYRKWILLLGFLYTAWLMAAVSGFFLVDSTAPELPSSARVLFAGLGVGLFAFSYSAIAMRLAERPKACLSLAVLANVFLALVIDAFAAPTFAALTGWYGLVGLTTFTVRESRDRLRYALDWRNWILGGLLIWFYVSAVYGKIPSKYAGGAPAPVVLYLNSPPAWMDSTRVSAQLLDEREDGYYILAPNTEKALFVPRSNVASVYFGRSDEIPKKK